MITTKDKVFIHIPRTGGSTLKQALRQENKAVWDPFPPVLDLATCNGCRPYYFWEDSKPAQRKTPYSIVRCPYERAASMYGYLTTNFYMQQFVVGSTFKEVMMDGLTGVGHQWLVTSTQSEILFSLLGKEVQVYHYEDGLSDFYALFGVNPKERVNASPFDYTMLDQEALDVIHLLFLEDFESFGYTQVNTVKDLIEMKAENGT